MSAARHPLFSSAPLCHDITLSTGPAPTPYHVYDGHGLIVLGTCAGDALDAAFTGQDVHPVLTQSGKGLLVVFVCDFPDASHGPHNELHITALAAPNAGEVLPDDPAAALAALATRSDWGVLSLHLWNDSPLVVAYNTEHLGLDARQYSGAITKAADRLRFDFKAADTALLSGHVALPKRSDRALMMRVMRHLGMRGLWRAATNKTTQAHVINRKSGVIPANRRAQTRTCPDKMVVTAFDPARDRLDLGIGPLAAYGFAPQVLEHLWPFRFVYLHPDDS